MSLLHAIAKPLLPPLLGALVRTLRLRIANPEILSGRETGGVIYAFWHGKMACGWLLSRRLFPERAVHAVVSLSKDGQLLSETLRRLGFDLIRGSSSRGGRKVMRAMLDELEKGGVVAVTPDGPRGPRHSFKYGTLRLASEHRLPLLFAEIAYTGAIELKSWDRFEIPHPFSAVNVTLHRVDVPVFERSEDIAVFERQLAKRLSDA